MNGKQNVWCLTSILLFCKLWMKQKRCTYNLLQRVSAFFMIAALLWLTISAPFVNSFKQSLDHYDSDIQLAPFAGTEEEAPNPLGGSEEKTSKSSSSSFSEEYLHDQHTSEYFFSLASQFPKCEKATTYVAFHGELLVPPPNKA